MKLSPIIAALRKECPSLERRVYGTAEFSSVESTTDLPMPCAYVIPLGESGEEMSMGTEYRQIIEQTFGIVMCVAVGSDQTGTEAFDRVETMKYEVIKAIAGARMPESEPDLRDDTDEIVYDGLTILDVNKARIAVQLEFIVRYQIIDEQTAHGRELAMLTPFDGMDVDVDQIVPDGLDKTKFSINFTKEG